MPSVNSGPATTGTANSVAEFVPVNTQTNSNPIGTNGLRLLATGRAVNLAVTGDAVVAPVFNSASYSTLYVYVTNAQLAGVAGSIASAAIGLWTGAAKTGTNLVANVTLASNTSGTVFFAMTVASTVLINGVSSPNIYINVGTALATATCDVFVYGFDAT